jgi:uncharacterized protein YukE
LPRRRAGITLLTHPTSGCDANTHLGGGIMAILGADLDDLDKLSKKLTQAGTTIDNLKTELDNFVKSTQWTGPNADKFHSGYDEFNQNFPKISHALNDASTAIDKQRQAIAQATGAA